MSVTDHPTPSFAVGSWPVRLDPDPTVPQAVLTAARSVDGNKAWRVPVGAHDGLVLRRAAVCLFEESYVTAGLIAELPEGPWILVGIEIPGIEELTDGSRFIPADGLIPEDLRRDVGSLVKRELGGEAER